MSTQRTRRAANQWIAGRRGLSYGLAALALVVILMTPPAGRADVIGIGDILPFHDDPETTENELVPMLPQFGNTAPGLPLVIVGGTNHFVGGTSTGQMTIDIPSDTDPLFAVQGIIGGNIFGLGQVRVLGLNSEFQLSEYLVVGWEGQGFLEVAAGGRVQSLPATVETAPDDDREDYDLVFGNLEGSQGFAEVDGFASLLLSGNLSVGHRGQGRIDMTNGSRMITINEASIGTVFNLAGDNGAIGSGYVLVDGPGTRWNVGVVPTTTTDPLPGGGTPPGPDTFDGLLTIGRQGRGTVEVRNKGWVRVETDTIIGEAANSFGKAVVSGADSLLWTLEDLFVGDAAGLATGELHLDDLGVARADGDGTSGGVSVGRLGLVHMTGGTLLAPNVTSGGVIRGDGRIESPNVVNTGDIRNAAGIANIRERLLFTGDLTNTENIESVGGEMEFQGVLTHTGPDADLVGIDAIFRFQGGLLSSGGANIFLQDTLVYVPAGSSLASAGSFSLWAGESTLVGDLDLASSNTLNVELGNPFGRLEVTGDATLAGNVNIFLADDYLPQIGDSFEIIEADSRTGIFASISGGGAGPGFWQASYTGSSAILNYVTDVISTLMSDFDGNGIVDRGDLDIWRMNFGLEPATLADGDANGDGRVDGADFMIWQQELGSMAAVAASGPAAGTVPEPSGLALALIGLAALMRRRKRPA